MDFLRDLLGNRMLGSAVLGWAVAQIAKAAIDYFYFRKFSLERLLGSGGMPSSHASTVAAMATTAACEYGAGSAQFAISVVLALVVMYDACGVRREAGEHARLLNALNATLDKNLSPEDMLKELLGHTPMQVLAGAVLGIVLGVILNLP